MYSDSFISVYFNLIFFSDDFDYIFEIKNFKKNFVIIDQLLKP